MRTKINHLLQFPENNSIELEKRRHPKSIVEEEEIKGMTL